jgi:hypothetical protein
MENQSLKANNKTPSFASFEELVPQDKKGKKELWLVLSIIAFIFLVREAGFINWYFYGFEANSQTHLSLNEPEYHLTDEISLNPSKITDTEATTKGKYYGVALPLFSRPSLTVDLAEGIQENLKHEKYLKVQVERIELNGLYWLPFYKSGTCLYQIHFQIIGKDSTLYNGEITGKTSFSVSGICSIRTLKEALGKEVANRAIKTVSDTIGR